jgi:lipopolysaccharide export system protein LptA
VLANIVRLGLLTLLTAGAGALALPEDRNKAIEIQSNEAIRIEPKGLTVYEGNVAIDQGSMKIRADKVSVYNTGSKVLRIVCQGNPAEFEQRPSVDAVPVMAKGNTITYNLETEIILLTGNASLVQEDATLSGERIEYDLKQEIIRAKGGDGDRIRMVIPPNQQRDVE